MSLGIAILLMGVWIVSLKSDEPTPDDLPADLDERTPLMAEPTSYANEAELQEEEAIQKPFGLESFKRMWREQPAGLAIGIAAPSPGKLCFLFEGLC
jgi:hypothetical protein